MRKLIALLLLDRRIIIIFTLMYRRIKTRPANGMFYFRVGTRGLFIRGSRRVVEFRFVSFDCEYVINISDIIVTVRRVF